MSTSQASPVTAIKDWILRHPKTVIVIFLAALYLPGVNRLFYFQGGDNAQYFMLAKSILQGHRYSDVYILPAGPHTKYPPLYSLLLAGIMLVFGENIVAMKLLNVGSVIIVGAASYGYFRKHDDTATSLMAAIVGASFTIIYDHADSILSDLVFLGLVFCGLRLYPEKSAAGSKRSLLLASLFMALCYFTRTAGIALALSFILAPLLARPLRQNLKSRLLRSGLFLLVFIIAAGSWNYRNYRNRASGGFTYLWELSQRDPYGFAGEDAHKFEKGWLDVSSLAGRLESNAHDYFKGFSFNLLVIPFFIPAAPAWILAVLFLIPVFFGLVMAWRRGPGLMEIFTVLYTVMILCWPYPSRRFLLPLFPLGAYYLMTGIRPLAGIAARRSPPIAGLMPAVLFLIILGASLVGDVMDVRQSSGYLHSSQSRKVNPYFIIMTPSAEMFNIMRMLDYVAEETEPDAVIQCRKETLCALQTNRHCIGIPRDKSIPEMMEYIDHWRINYIVLDQVYAETEDYLFPALKANRDRFEEVYNVPGTENIVLYVIR